MPCYSLRTLLILLAIGPPLVAGVWLTGRDLATLSGIDDAYAENGAADMVIGFMRDNEGDWPRNWKALKPYFNKNNGRVTGWSFEKFQQRIYIDFKTDSSHLRRLSIRSQKVSFDVIHARSPLAARIGEGPNALLYTYFCREQSFDVAERAKAD